MISKFRKSDKRLHRKKIKNDARVRYMQYVQQIYIFSMSKKVDVYTMCREIFTEKKNIFMKIFEEGN